MSAALIVLVASIIAIIWYRNRSEAERASITGVKEEDTGIPNPETPELTGAKAHVGWNARAFEALHRFVREHGLTITSEDKPGKHTGHSPNSKHYRGEAIDVAATVSLADILAWAKAAGFRVLDERYTGEGRYGKSTGPHYHLEVP